MTRRLTVTAMAIAIPLLAADSAMACSCVQRSVAEKLEEADGAFVGRLIAVREVDPPEEGEPIGSGDPMHYVYRVGRVAKRGPGLRRGNRVRVRSARDSATCGLPRQRGKLYGLFVRRENRRWHGNLCSMATPAQMRRAAEANSAATGAPPGCG